MATMKAEARVKGTSTATATDSSSAGAARAKARAARVALAMAIAIAMAMTMVGGTWRPGSAAPDVAAPAAAGPEKTYLLLLHWEDGDPAPAANVAAVEAARVAEYSAWARDLAAQNRLIGAEKLADGAFHLGPPLEESAGRQPVLGFFWVRAADDEAARAIASTCPHLRHGGTVVVRPIDDRGGR